MMTEHSSGRELAGAIIDLLKNLFVENETFLITSQSMYRLLSLYEKELLDAIEKDRGVELIVSWKEEVEEFREAWITSQSTERVALRTISRPVATESSTEDARAKCSKRKQSGGPGRPRRRPTPPRSR